ncbi:MAG: response regulator transcription factor [Candidatus Marinimicrobia bacterium]|nr:response regulator transcription factor [Candidatus Neomarinimicrobiota bacterium]
MISIILVDDHTIMRDGLRNVLEEEADIEIVGEADNGRDAVKLALEKNPDIIVTDIGMHNMNGIEAARQIKNGNPNIKIIALSAHSERQIVVGMFRAGASGYLLKESSSLELVKAIRTVYLGRNYLSQNISDIVLKELSSVKKDSEEIGSDILTYRESEILQLMSEGNTTKKIGEILFISPKTVESHRANIMEKLNIHNIPELTKYAIRAGLTSLDK